MNPIDLSKLANFDNTQPLDNVIERLTKIDNLLALMADNSKKQADAYVSNISSIIDATKKLEGELDTLDATRKEEQETILKIASQSDKLLKKNDQIKQSFKDEETLLKQLLEAQNKLKAAKDKLADTNKAEAGSIDDLKKKLGEATKAYMAMGDATDDAVKQDALDRVKGLSKAIAEGEQALKDAKKATDVAAGSYNELKIRVENARKQIKAMEGGIGSNTKQFKELQKFVKEGSDKLKEFDEALGDSRPNVGNYQDALSHLPSSFQNIIASAKQAYQAVSAFLASPIGMAIAALAAGIALIAKSVQTYFSESIEGQDRLGELTATWNGALEITKQRLESIGEGALDLFTNPKKAFQDFGNYIKNWWEDFTAAASGGWEVVKNVLSFNVAGAKKALEELKKTLRDIYKEEIQMIEQSRLSEKLLADIRKEKIRDIVDDAATELRVNKLIVDSKNKLRFADEERFNKLRKANKILEDQLKGDLDLIQMEIDQQIAVIRSQGGIIDQRIKLSELNDQELTAIGVKYEELEKLAALQASQIELENNFFSQRKKRQAEEIALIREIEKETQDRINREIEAQRTLNNFLSQGRIDANRKLIADERSTLEDRLEALADIQEDQEELAQDQFDKEFDIAREAALARIQLSSDTLDKIYANETISINDRIAQERAAKEQLLDQDKAYVDSVTKLNIELAAKIKAINDQTVQDTQDTVFKQWADDYEDFIDGIDTQAATEALDLVKVFEAGEISLRDFEKARKLIQDEAQTDRLKSQLDYLEQQKEALQKAGYDVTNLERQIAQTRLALADQNNRALLDREKQLQEALKELRTVAYETTLSIVDSFNEAQDIRRQEEMEKLTLNYENELLLAGDNEEKKAQLTNDFNQQKLKLDREQAEADRKKATFDKLRSIFEIGINTAVGISKAVSASPLTGGLPFSAIIAALGALQIAAVLARPIPSYAKGTESAAGGLSQINEEGPELIVSPSGRARVYDTKGPILADIEKGSKIFTAKETRRLREHAEFNEQMIAGFDDDTQRLKHIKVEVETETMVNALSRKFDVLTDAVKRKKPVHFHPANIAREVARGLNLAQLERTDYR